MINMNLRTSKTFKLLVGFDIPYIYVKGELGIVFSRVCLLGRDTNRAEIQFLALRRIELKNRDHENGVEGQVQNIDFYFIPFPIMHWCCPCIELKVGNGLLAI